MCASGKGPATSTPSKDRRSRGWRPSPATGRWTKFGGCDPLRSTIRQKGSNRLRRKSTRLARANARKASRRSSDCLKGLDEEKRAIVLLAYYRGLSREALAKRFGRPVPTIKTWLRRSLAQLQGLPPVMTISPDDDFAAAEYALGTLDASERATLAARRLREPELDEAIRAWEERLAPLVEATPEIEPPGDLLPAIQARIRG